jgi:hypothetical protein
LATDPFAAPPCARGGEEQLVNLIKYIQERRRAHREEIGRRARAEAEQRGQRLTYSAPNRSASRRRRYWK